MSAAAVEPHELLADLVVIDDAAAQLKITRPTLFRLIRRGRLARIRHASRSYVPQASIDDYVARLRADAEKARAAAAKQHRSTRQASTAV